MQGSVSRSAGHCPLSCQNRCCTSLQAGAGQTSVDPCLKRHLPPQLCEALPLAVTTSSPGERVTNAPLSVARLQIQHLEPLALHLYLAMVHALKPAQEHTWCVKLTALPELCALQAFTEEGPAVLMTLSGLSALHTCTASCFIAPTKQRQNHRLQER